MCEGQSGERALLQFHNVESLRANQTLYDQMFQDRRRQFIDRLNWGVRQDGYGRELDEYDNSKAKYVVWVGEKGQHLGSLRLTESNHQSMIMDHFRSEFAEHFTPSAGCWEITRFCVSPSVTAQGQNAVSSQLVKGVGLFGVENRVTNYFGLCFPPMLRIYKRLGWPPSRVDRGLVTTGLLLTTWNVDTSQFSRLYFDNRDQHAMAA